MSSQLIVTEKPRVAEKVAAALSGGLAKRVMMHGVSVFELSRGGKKIIVSPAVGHVYTLRAKEKGSGYPVFDIEWVPSSEEGEGSAFTKKYLDAIRSAGKNADEVVNACDYDIEGSLIGGNIIRFACKGKAAKRMHFSTLTSEDLISAYESLEPLDEPQINAGEARHILDWYWGINSSRALMQSIRAAGSFRIMSIGRVQGPALAILAHREKEISAFVSTPYWELFSQLKGIAFKHEKDRFLQEKEAQAALADCKNSKDAIVQKVERQKFKQKAPFPFDLTSLQIEAHSVLGIDPSKTLKIAQSLYENALISYPRTSSQKLPAKLGLAKIISALAKNPAYEKLARQLLEKKLVVPSEGAKEDAAHPAIHPTGTKPQGLAFEEQKLYDLVARRFLSCFAPDALREKVKVSAKISSQTFAATGATTLEKGWFEFYEPYLRFDEEPLPLFSDGERCKVEKLDLLQKQTQPPKRFTAASLIKKLESENLGTKATRAEVIETLKRRGYFDGKSFEVTPLGMAVFEALHKNVSEVLSEQLTRKFEEEMDGIQSGEFTKEHVIEDGRLVLSKILEKFKQKELEIGKGLAGALQETRREQSVLGPCRVCKEAGRDGTLAIKKSKFGQLIGCTKYPECKVVYSLPRNALVAPDGSVCEKCGIPKVKIIRKGVRPSIVCPNPSCGESTQSSSGQGTDARQEMPSDFGECTVCKAAGRVGRMTVKRSIYGRFLGCTSYPDCRALYPLPKDANAVPTGNLCKKCGAPIAKISSAPGLPEVEKCLNPKCESNEGRGNQGERMELGKCPSCKAEGRKNGALLVKRSRFGFLAGCSNYPACKQCYSIPRDSVPMPLGKECEKCGAPIVKMIQGDSTAAEQCLNSKCESNGGKIRAQNKETQSAGLQKATEKQSSQDATRGIASIDEAVTKAKAAKAEKTPKQPVPKAAKGKKTKV